MQLGETHINCLLFFYLGSCVCPPLPSPSSQFFICMVEFPQLFHLFRRGWWTRKTMPLPVLVLMYYLDARKWALICMQKTQPSGRMRHTATVRLKGIINTDDVIFLEPWQHTIYFYSKIMSKIMLQVFMIFIFDFFFFFWIFLSVHHSAVPRQRKPQNKE